MRDLQNDLNIKNGSLSIQIRVRGNVFLSVLKDYFNNTEVFLKTSAANVFPEKHFCASLRARVSLVLLQIDIAGTCLPGSLAASPL